MGTTCVLDQGGPGPPGSPARHRELAQLEILRGPWRAPGAGGHPRGDVFWVILTGPLVQNHCFPLAGSRSHQQAESRFRVKGEGRRELWDVSAGPLWGGAATCSHSYQQILQSETPSHWPDPPEGGGCLSGRQQSNPETTGKAGESGWAPPALSKHFLGPWVT